jgi:hypothetical protein
MYVFYSIDLYANKVGDDPATDQLFLKLYDEVTKETKYMTELLEVKGCLDMLMAGAKYHSRIPNLPGVVPVAKLVPSEQAQQTLVVKIRD